MQKYALAFEVVVADFLLIVGGYHLDDFLSTSPLFILVGTFLSMGFTIWSLIKFNE
ncbi:MAG: AtpZ/AtpI family protein [Bacteroidota bacterium]